MTKDEFEDIRFCKRIVTKGFYDGGDVYIEFDPPRLVQSNHVQFSFQDGDYDVQLNGGLIAIVNFDSQCFEWFGGDDADEKAMFLKAIDGKDFTDSTVQY